jgi:hypothetical protein
MWLKGDRGEEGRLKLFEEFLFLSALSFYCRISLSNASQELSYVHNRGIMQITYSMLRGRSSPTVEGKSKQKHLMSLNNV